MEQGVCSVTHLMDEIGNILTQKYNFTCAKKNYLTLLKAVPSGITVDLSVNWSSHSHSNYVFTTISNNTEFFFSP